MLGESLKKQNVIKVITTIIKYILIYNFKQAIFIICGFIQFKSLFIYT